MHTQSLPSGQNFEFPWTYVLVDRNEAWNRQGVRKGEGGGGGWGLQHVDFMGGFIFGSRDAAWRVLGPFVHRPRGSSILRHDQQSVELKDGS